MLLARHGLESFHVEPLRIRHGQLRVWIGHRGARPIEPSVVRQEALERAAGLDRREVYIQLAARAERVRAELRRELQAMKLRGATVAGYGAPAKASTLAAYCGLGPQDLPWIADRNRLKHGRFTPGTHIPITGVERIDEDRPEALLLFAWNFTEEIMAQLADYRSAGGRFLIPVPEVRHV